MRLTIPVVRVGVVLGVGLGALSLVACDKLMGSSSSGGAAASASAPTSAPASATPATTSTPPARAAGALPASAPVVGDAMKAKCELKASEVKGEKNTARIVECPSGCMHGSVWGTDLYTDDSVVCAAMIHAGVIPESGGKGAITFVQGQATYLGTQRHGIASSSYGRWARSFYAQALDASGKPTGAAPVPDGDMTAHIACTDSSSSLEGASGAVWHIICPANCAPTDGSVWGSSPFTADSSICTAGIFAGIIKGDQVAMDVTFGGKQPSMKGGTANGVTTQDFGPFEKTYTLSKKP